MLCENASLIGIVMGVWGPVRGYLFVKKKVTIQPSRGLLIKIGQSAVEENLESIRRSDSVFSASGEVTAEAAENLGAFHGTKTA